MAVARTEHVICRCDRHPSQRERPACGWRPFSEGLGRCPRRASSGFHPKRQTPFRVKNAKTVLLFRLLRSRLMLAHPLLAAKAGLPRSAAQQPGEESDEHRRLRTHQPSIANELESRASPRPKPWDAESAKEQITHPL